MSKEIFTSISEYQKKVCFNCGKKAWFSFFINKEQTKCIDTCKQHSKDFDPNKEDFLTVVIRYDGLLNHIYPDKRYRSEEDEQKILEADFNLKRHDIKVKELEMKRLLTRVRN